ncbi:MAG: AGE family epimerase/isomerase [Hyphomonas sp.]|tara:strand:- start:33985 stop:35220 length:1236 start_codon:yes stop_codon:yes gene_type:complete
MTGDSHSVPPILASLRGLVPRASRELVRVADWWLDHSVDHASGGYFGQVGLDGLPVAGVPLSAVLMSRILWFFSEVSRHTGDSRYLAESRRAKAYFESSFVDPVHGGIVWQVDHEGRTVDARKQGYAQAFAIYALAAHYRATRDESALRLACDLFHCVETRFGDVGFGGYWEAFAQDWTPIADVRLSEKDDHAPKTMNTHLHILEAYSELYAAYKTPKIAAALRHCIEIHLDRIVTPDHGNLRLFLMDDWTDQSREMSFGHNIEASWLIHRGAIVLGDERIVGKARSVALSLAESVLTEAMGPHGEVYNARDIATGVTDEARIWWIQAEAVVGFLNAFEISSDPRFVRAAIASWEFIEKEIIDPHGEWRSHSRLDTELDPWWAGPWKGCYHNGRAMIEMTKRISRLMQIKP